MTNSNIRTNPLKVKSKKTPMPPNDLTPVQRAEMELEGMDYQGKEDYMPQEISETPQSKNIPTEDFQETEMKEQTKENIRMNLSKEELEKRIHSLEMELEKYLEQEQVRDETEFRRLLLKGIEHWFIDQRRNLVGIKEALEEIKTSIDRQTRLQASLENVEIDK